MMTTPLALFAIAALVGGLAGYPLASARWTRQAPRMAVALWHAMCFGVISSIVLGGLALALPALPLVLTGTLSEFLDRCATALRTAFAAPSSLTLGIVGLALTLVTIGRIVAAGVASAREARGVRRAQRARLTLAGRRLRSDHAEDLVLLMDDRPAAYCLPGSRGRGTIVISSGSLDLLSDDQLRLVLAHERAHLRQRHHLATQLSGLLKGAFGWVPLFGLAAREVPLLLEMAADDQAIGTTTIGQAERTRLGGDARKRLAHALVTLASAQSTSPTGALAAAGGSAIARVHRLSEPPLRLSATQLSLVGFGVAVAFAGPTLVASAPAVCAAAMEICPFVFS